MKKRKGTTDFHKMAQLTDTTLRWFFTELGVNNWNEETLERLSIEQKLVFRIKNGYPQINLGYEGIGYSGWCYCCTLCLDLFQTLDSYLAHEH